MGVEKFIFIGLAMGSGVTVLSIKERRSNKFYLTEFGCRKFFQISYQIEKKINVFLKLSSPFKVFLNL